MTPLSPAGRVMRLQRVFEKSGGTGAFTRRFDAMAMDVQARLRGLAVLEATEIPVLAYYRDDEHWVLLTTERLRGRGSQGFHDVRCEEIENATVNEVGHGSTSALRGKGKLSLTILSVALSGGRTLHLELEPGPPFIGFWNVLKTVANLGAADRGPTNPGAGT